MKAKIVRGYWRRGGRIIHAPASAGTCSCEKRTKAKNCVGHPCNTKCNTRINIVSILFGYDEPRLGSKLEEHEDIARQCRDGIETLRVIATRHEAMAALKRALSPFGLWDSPSSPS